ncbi:MAG: NAD-dependent epimerase/dehydratase family protein, partial [Bacteroidia bacterium]
MDTLPPTKILVIGALGQIGSELTDALRQMYGQDNVIASDIRKASEVSNVGLYEQLDVTNKERLYQIINDYQITIVYNLAAVLSAKGEQNPMFAWHLNMTGLLNTLEAARETCLKQIFWPSSIAVFGPTSPKNHTPQTTVMEPNTVYGISKLAGERLCAYYSEKFGIDVRSIRYPGLIGYKSMPGGGTTDYAVSIYHSAVKGEHFECFLSENTPLPMMYMEDAIRATIELMTAPSEQVKIRSSYNLAGMSFTPVEIAAAIQKEIPTFSISYQPDFRQKIAD